MSTSTASQHPPPLPTFDEATCEIVVNYRIPSTALSPIQFVIPFSLNRPSELLMTDLDDDDDFKATHHVTCLLSELSACLAEVPMMFVTEIKVVSRGYSGNPRRKEEEEDDSEEEDSVDVADERLNDVPNVQMKCEAQQEVDTHVDAEEETQAQLDQGRNPDGHRPWRPLSSAALQSIQHKQSQQAQRTAYTDFDHDDSDDIVLDYEQDGHDVQQASVGRSNKRRALPFGSGLLEALQPGAKRSRAT